MPTAHPYLDAQFNLRIHVQHCTNCTSVSELETEEDGIELKETLLQGTVDPRLKRRSGCRNRRTGWKTGVDTSKIGVGLYDWVFRYDDRAVGEDWGPFISAEPLPSCQPIWPNSTRVAAFGCDHLLR